MGKMEKIQKPPQVERARARGDTFALSAMGTEGGVHSSLIRADKKARAKEDLRRLVADQERLAHINGDGDVLPPDPKIVEEIEQQ